MLFVAEITFLSTKEPKHIKLSKKDINYSTIEFTALQGSSIDKNGISETIKALKALKFKTHDELYEFNTTFQQKGVTHTLSSSKARYENDKLFLSGDVHYENNQSMQIKSKELEYNVNTKIAKSLSPFTLRSSKGNMVGDSFVYDMTNNTIEGEKMQYRFEVDEE